ncbi:hypothetical protein NECID01_0551 [Nematocida sp. AWRm77]|nr:hypothetical protein NECID01_0551 [Nematocida sp. AWRm77]
MSALLDLSSMVRLIVLFSCTVTYIKPMLPKQLSATISEKENTQGMTRLVYIGTVIGERLSPFLALICVYYSLTSFIGLFWW